jgi:hypothetical protein
MGRLRKLHNGEILDLYSLLIVIRMSMLRRKRWAEAYSMNGGEDECI